MATWMINKESKILNLLGLLKIQSLDFFYEFAHIQQSEPTIF